MNDKTTNHNSNDSSEWDATDKRLQEAGLSAEEAFNFLGCCAEYRRAFYLIKKYDEEGDIPNFSTETGENYVLKPETANLIISEFRNYLESCREDARYFGVPHNGGVEKTLQNIYQTWGGEDLYKDLESKAAHLFYFLIKDHLFVDGNKRIASFLLLWLLDMSNMLIIEKEEKLINYTTIYALAIFVAESNPKDKDIVVQFVYQLIMAHRKTFPENLSFDNF